MEGLREQMMDVDEIGQTLNEASMGAVDEGEVEDELEALENVEKEKVEAVERKEREAREAKQAEETKRRLAELDSLDEKKPEEATQNREMETEPPA
jgi:charged multivesicular body protein 7